MDRICSKRALLALMLFFVVGTTVSHAAVIYSNFGLGDSFDDSFNYAILGEGVVPVGFSAVGTMFTSSSDYFLDTIELAAGYSFGTNSLIVKLMVDSSGVPGAKMEEWTFNNIKDAGINEILKGDSSLHPLLESGMQYWLVAFPGGTDSHMAWMITDPKVFGSMAVSDDGGKIWSTFTGMEGAFRISGTPAPVPEPSTMILIGSGLAGLAGYGRRKFKK